MKKNFIFLLFFTFFSLTGIAQDKSYQLSSHILDIHTGKPAPGVTISLSRQDTSGRWSVIEERKTDENGRVKDFLEATPEGHPGIYKLTYQVGPYFEAQGQDSFYPFIEVVFQIKDNAHYHVPITLSPYGYSTYGGIDGDDSPASMPAGALGSVNSCRDARLVRPFLLRSRLYRKNTT